MAKCGKRCYDSKAAAEFDMRKIPASPLGKIPVRAYRCRPCKAWHLTSGPRRRRRA